ncbi:hypothetical protein EYZ11_013346 [Aspergillus tanneri]|uniref:Retroviral polymerase SH3-like domain-containing protein n=1 Tax=Aspergillus tanneri TaxID=1220188 RepID=A0A4S3IXW2_9EURO|nr:hypothetical protein EYZ11_013346 [Aspergillus tanneri]
MEFWDKAAKAHAYIHNRVAIPQSAMNEDEDAITPEELWTGSRPKITHIKVWGSKCYSHADPRSVPGSNKLTDRGRVGIFVGYNEETTKQYRIYAPDSHRVIRASTVIFDEDTPGGTIDLKLRIKSTSTALPDRNPVGRPRKQDKISPTSRDSSPEPADNEQYETAAESFDHDHLDDRHRKRRDSVGASNEEPIPARTQEMLEVRKPTKKRERTDDESVQSANLRRSKRLKLKEQKWRDKVDEMIHFALLVETITKTAPKVDNPIPIPRTYEEAINDPVYGPEWKKAIRSEFRSLIINGTFRETHAPDGANIVTAKWVFAVNCERF